MVKPGQIVALAGNSGSGGNNLLKKSKKKIRSMIKFYNT